MLRYPLLICDPQSVSPVGFGKQESKAQIAKLGSMQRERAVVVHSLRQTLITQCRPYRKPTLTIGHEHLPVVPAFQQQERCRCESDNKDRRTVRKLTSPAAIRQLYACSPERDHTDSFVRSPYLPTRAGWRKCHEQANHCPFPQPVRGRSCRSWRDSSTFPMAVLPCGHTPGSNPPGEASSHWRGCL